MILQQLSKSVNVIFILNLILILISSSCFAKENSQSKTSHAVINLSQFISYTNSKTEQRQPIIFETIKDNIGIDTKIMGKPSNTNVITPDLDLKAEKIQIERQKGAVTRTGKTLIVKRPSAPPFVFKDYSKPAKNNKEGDSQKYVYAGPLGGTGYHMVETTYMHDSPGTYFVNPNVDTMLYAHTSDHSVYLSANNRLLIINNSPNPPFGLVIASLSEKGHKIELHCTSHISNDPKLRSQFEGWDNKVNGEFKGWHESPEIGFDLLVKLPNIGENAKQNKDTLPVQFSFSSGQWHIFVPDTKQKHLSSRLSCWQ